MPEVNWKLIGVAGAAAAVALYIYTSRKAGKKVVDVGPAAATLLG